MKPTVLITTRIPKPGLECLYEGCRVLYPEDKPSFSEEELLCMAPDIQGLLAVSRISNELLKAARGLKIICNYGAGYDNMDIAAATRLKIPVATIPDTVTYSTAELAFALLLSLTREIPTFDRNLRSGPPEENFGIGLKMGHNLRGKRLGILGMGRIGRCVARMARGFGMRISYHNRTHLPEDQAGGAEYLPLEELLARCDVLSIHCPLTDETRGLIGGAQLALMKPGAMLINTARGAIVDEAAMIAALKAGALAGAGLDVYASEPHIPDELRTLPNVVLTPHVGSNTFEARREMALAASDVLVCALAGRRPGGIINPEVYG